MDEGYLRSRPRSGLLVCESISSAPPAAPLPRPIEPSPPHDRMSFPRPFQASRPDVRLFPLAIWNRARGRALKKHRGTLLQYQSELPLGLPVLHIRRCRREYSARLDTFLTAMRRTGLPLEFPHADGGINISGFLPQSSDDAAWACALGAMDVEAQAHSQLAIGTVRPGLIFGFTAFDHATIRAAVRRMRKFREPKNARVSDG